MSGSFTGFSEDDIRKLNNKKPEEIIQLPNKARPKTKRNTSNNPQVINSNTVHSSELRSKILKEKIQNSSVEPISENAKLNKASVSINDSLNCDKTTVTNDHVPQMAILTSTQYADELKNIVKSLQNEASEGKKLDNQVNIADSHSNNSTTHTNIMKKTEKAVTLLEKKLDLDEFQARQKLMEEQNRKRKELLTKALAVKTKQTQEEAQKLNEVREEFKKLDALLSTDVKILRKQIEVASLDYMEAQKRYFKIEKEFLDAKLNLHQKLERKEMLTEHLCTIIEKNEERKAEKLNELLLKLNLKSDMEDDVHEPDVPALEKNDNEMPPTESTSEIQNEK